MVGLLAACAGHGRELEFPESPCVDASGYEVVCDDPSAAGMVSVPEDRIASSSDGTPASEGCPIRPTGRPPSGSSVEPPMGSQSPEAGEPAVPSEQGEPGAEEPEPTSAKMRVNFSIDPDQTFIRGMVVVGQYEERDFVPTEQLWTESKERRAERRRHRRRWRERGSTVSSR